MFDLLCNMALVADPRHRHCSNDNKQWTKGTVIAKVVGPFPRQVNSIKDFVNEIRWRRHREVENILEIYEIVIMIYSGMEKGIW